MEYYYVIFMASVNNGGGSVQIFGNCPSCYWRHYDR